MNVPVGHNGPHESSPEHVMDRIAEQILGSAQDGNDGTTRLFASPLARRIARLFMPDGKPARAQRRESPPCR